MNATLLATKFFVPPPRVKAVERAELSRRLSEDLSRGDGFSRKLTLVSAPPGFGKTSLVSEWLAALPIRAAWLSLDEKDNDPARFLTYLVSALQTAEPGLGAWVLGALQVPQPPSLETLLTRLVNDLAESDKKLILVLDDYHTINSPSVDEIDLPGGQREPAHGFPGAFTETASLRLAAPQGLPEELGGPLDRSDM